jgi:hypothetical protein
VRPQYPFRFKTRGVVELASRARTRRGRGEESDCWVGTRPSLTVSSSPAEPAFLLSPFSGARRETSSMKLPTSRLARVRGSSISSFTSYACELTRSPCKLTVPCGKGLKLLDSAVSCPADGVCRYRSSHCRCMSFAKPMRGT